MANKICFIVGHGKSKAGGYDSGAVSKDGKFHEFKIVKEIAKYAQEYYNATYVEQADLMNYNGDLYLADRIKKANANAYDLIMEIHLNSATSTTATGVECYYENKDNIGYKYADAICDQIAADLGVAQRPYGTDADGGDKVKLNSDGDDYFGIIRQPTKVNVRLLVETVFISNTSDLAKVNTAAGQKKAGEAIAKAVAQVRGAKKKEVAPVVTTTTSGIKKGDLVSIKSGAKYYNGPSIPSWVIAQKWYVESVSGDRAVINKNEKGTSGINSPINVMYLTVVKKATTVTATVKPTIKVGSTVKVKEGAKTYTGGKIASFVYKRKHKVKELKGDRAVITYLGITVAAVKVSDLTLV